MKAGALKLVLFLAGLVLLQQGIAFGHAHVDRLGRHAAVVAENDIDPSALFYTESPLALKAEKEVRQALNFDP